MTLVILGLDALDAAQVEHYDIDAFRLRTHGEMETVAHQNPIPHTGEVWPTIATGLHPSEHGITHGGESQWDNPVIEVISRLVGPYISMHTRADLGRIVRTVTGADWEIAETDADTMFDGDGRHVHNWPGTVNGNVVREVWRHINHTVEKGTPQEEFDRLLWGTAAQKFAWVREMLSHDAVLVASHVHVLDASGHAYGTNEEHYRVFYEKAARYVGDVRAAMDDDDDLLLLSDHGMNTAWLPVDTEVRHHSWRAFSASTLDSRPASVFDVKDWVEAAIESHRRPAARAETDLDLPEAQLRDLGYIQ